MNPLDDNELQKTLTEKLNGLEPQETDHLWAGIERSLPVQTGGGMIINFVKLAVGVGALTAILMSDQDVLAERNDFDFIQTEIDHPVKISSAIHVTPVDEFQPADSKPFLGPTNPFGLDEAEIRDELTEAQKNPNPITTKHEQLVVDQYWISRRNPTIRPETHLEPSMQRIPDARKIKKSGNWFWSGSSYLTFHSMEPSRLDENFINSDPTANPSISDRVGVNASFGYAHPISHRLTLHTSAGFDYYRTTFQFRIINDINPSTSLRNNRLDLGLNIGLSYRHRGFTNNESIEASVGYRTALKEFHSGVNTYSRQLLTYRLGYLINHRSWQFGPFYSSFINSRDYVGFGRITPTIYGVMLRRNLGN